MKAFSVAWLSLALAVGAQTALQIAPQTAPKIAPQAALQTPSQTAPQTAPQATPQKALHTAPFSAWWLSAEVGVSQGLGEFYKVLDVAPQIRLGVETVYTPNWRALVNLGYTYLRGWNLAERPDLGEIPLHDFRGQVGLVRRGWRGAQMGAGLNLFLLRTAVAENSSAYQYLVQQGYYIQDNESEFGWHLRWSSPELQRGAWTVAVHSVWEQAWTLPRRTHFISLSLGVKHSWF